MRLGVYSVCRSFFLCFPKTVNIWKSNSISLSVRVKLYESLVISTLLYGAELWPLPVTQIKKSEVAHHKFQWRLLVITWKDKVRNEHIRKKTKLRKLEQMIKERRPRWLGHVLRMENSRISHQAMQWKLSGSKRKPGRSRKNWIDIVRRDLKDMDTTRHTTNETVRPSHRLRFFGHLARTAQRKITTAS